MIFFAEGLRRAKGSNGENRRQKLFFFSIWGKGVRGERPREPGVEGPLDHPFVGYSQNRRVVRRVAGLTWRWSICGEFTKCLCSLVCGGAYVVGFPGSQGSRVLWIIHLWVIHEIQGLSEVWWGSRGDDPFLENLQNAFVV